MAARRNSTLNLLLDIAAAEGLTDRQTSAFVATARQESGLNPSAIGDSGTSFGLFQHHIGGAGGTSKESAQRYLNPRMSAKERAKWFKKWNITTGEGAARLQRPADPSGYARSVNNLLSGKQQGASGLQTPLAPQSNPQASDRLSLLSKYMSGGPLSFSVLGKNTGTGSSSDSPNHTSILGQYSSLESSQSNPLYQLQRLRASRLRRQASLADHSSSSPTAQGDSSGSVTATSWKDLQRMGRTKFGLQNDPGDSQTTGGGHTRGSEHYDGRAIDFGTARNSVSQLKKAMAWYKSKGFDVLWEGDHLHVSMPGSGI